MDDCSIVNSPRMEQEKPAAAAAASPSAPPLLEELAEMSPASQRRRQGPSYQELREDLHDAGSGSTLTQSISVDGDDFEFVSASSIPITDNYSRDIERIGSISFSRRSVMGLALVRSTDSGSDSTTSLFAVYLKSNAVCLYNVSRSSSSGSPFSPPSESHLIVPDLLYPRGIAASNPDHQGSTGCLYVTDKRKFLGSTRCGRLWKISLRGAVLSFEDFHLEPFGVSVAPRNHRIIVACSLNTRPVKLPLLGVGHILIFEDVGTRLREVSSIRLEDSVEIPRHVIEAPAASGSGLSSAGGQEKGKGKGKGKRREKEYIVCHGWNILPGMESHHRVSRIDGQGKILGKFGTGHGNGERQLMRPMSLCLDNDDDDDEGLMFVADSHNDRVILMTTVATDNHDLDLIRPLVTRGNGVVRPKHVCYDKATGILYVGQESGRIDVYGVRNLRSMVSSPTTTTTTTTATTTNRNEK